MEQEFELIAKTFQGLEEVLAQELTELGADNVQIGRRMVSFTGNKAMMYRANFCLRTAVRVLKPIKRFKAKDPDDVYEAVKSINWEDYLDVTTSFVVDSVVYSTEFRHSKFVAYRVKDAIADYFREKTGERPNIRLTNPDIRLNIHIAETECTLSLDSSGESLHLRGYRTATVDAPINEVLAAAMIRMSGWKYDTDFIDPFCGSGTIAIEAALMARNIYPGVFRKEFGFEKWKDFDGELFDEIYNDDSQERNFDHHIYCYDLNLRAVEAAVANAKSAGVADIVTVAQRDIRKFTRPEAPALIITNPPYGERLQSSDLLEVYRVLGEKLKKEITGGEAWVITSKEELFDAMHLRPSYKIPLQNGSLDCELRKYVTFDGKMENFLGQGGVVKTDDERKRMEKRHFRDGRERDFSRASRRENDDMDFGEDKELAARYRTLRSRHDTNERVRRSQERKEHTPREDRDRKPYDRDRKPYDRDRKPYDRDRKPYDRDRKPYDRDRKPYDRDRKPYDRDRKPYDRDRKPYDRDRKPYDRDKKPRRHS